MSQRTHGSGGVKAAAQRLLFHNPANQTGPKFDVLVAIGAVVGQKRAVSYMTMKARDLCDICKVSPVEEVLIQGSYNYKLMGSVLTNPVPRYSVMLPIVS